MLFNSFTFAVFLIVVLAIYRLLGTPRRQNPFLLVTSLVFYGFGGPWFVLLILLCALTAYTAGIMIENNRDRSRAALILGALIPLAILFVFKYFDFFFETVDASLDAFGLPMSEVTLRLGLPIGISFFTFQAVGYVADVHRGSVPAERNAIDFFLFVTFFPQLVAGPIERADHLLPQIKKPRRVTDADIGGGVFLILQGFAKKVVIADNIKPIVDTLFELDGLSGPLIIAALIGFTFQIYGDFSGYSDIARGVSRLMGFELLENFHRPYWARNPSDFWRRWHMTLSNWFRDYVYIALGGNRSGPTRTLVNLLATMTLSGLWHGASVNFVLWGAFHGVILIGHRLWRDSKPKAMDGPIAALASRAAMFAFTVYGWMLFRVTDWGTLKSYHQSLVTDTTQGSLAIITLVTLLPYIALAVIIDLVESRALPTGYGEPRGRFVLAGYFAALTLIIVVYGAASGGEFIYFKF